MSLISGENFTSNSVVAVRNKDKSKLTLKFDVCDREKKVIVKILLYKGEAINKGEIFIYTDSKLFMFKNIDELKLEKELINFNDEIIDFIINTIAEYCYYLFFKPSIPSKNKKKVRNK